MRDITFGPEQTRTIWKNEGVYPLLDEVYDRILIYGDKHVFDPISAYDMSPQAAARTRFCGYLAPTPPRRSPPGPDEVGAENLPLSPFRSVVALTACAPSRLPAGLREGLGLPFFPTSSQVLCCRKKIVRSSPP